MSERIVVCMFSGDVFAGASGSDESSGGGSAAREPAGYGSAASILTRLDERGCAVHVFGGDMCRAQTPAFAGRALYEYLNGRLESGAAFITDMPSLMSLVYRLFHNTFDVFALAPPTAGAGVDAGAGPDAGAGTGAGAVAEKLGGARVWRGRDYETVSRPYAELLETPASEREGLAKPVYLIAVAADSLPDSLKRVAAAFLPFGARVEETIAAPGAAPDYSTAPRKVYACGGVGYSFEPALGETLFIRLGAGSGSDNGGNFRSASGSGSGISGISLCYPHRKIGKPGDIVSAVSRFVYSRGEFNSIAVRLGEAAITTSEELRFASALDRIAALTYISINCEAIPKIRKFAGFNAGTAARLDARRKILVLSCLVQTAGSEFIAAYARSTYEALRAFPFTWTERFFALCQTRIATFLAGMRENYMEIEAATELLSDIVAETETARGSRLARLAPPERDPGRVIVFTTQFLGEEHAPTAMVFELCRYIKRTQKRDVTIVNTMEAASPKGFIPFARPYSPNHVCETVSYRRTSAFGGSMTRDAQYRGESFAYVDYGDSMADSGGIDRALKLVAQIRPYYAVCVGAPSVVAELCASVVPVINFCGQAGLPFVLRQAAVAVRDLSDTEEKLVRRFYRSPNMAIVCPSYHPKFELTRPFDRRVFGLPADRKLLAVVGNRLETEVDETFLVTLRSVVDKTGAFVVFIGRYGTFDKVKAGRPWMAGCAAFIGYHMDLMGAIAMCDIFVNPPRSGGATSAAMALACGKPVATLSWGDVFETAGAPFAFETQSDMITALEKYTSDSAFYDRMSALARKRANEVCDAAASYDIAFDKFFRGAAWEWERVTHE